MRIKVYLPLVEPEKYPEFNERAAKAVTRKALGNEIQFSSLRGFPTTSTNLQEIGEAADMGSRPMPDNDYKLKEIEETIDMYVNHFKLGKVLWPVYPTLFAANFNELVDICADKKLFLYDFWGYVPGSKPKDGIWGEYNIPVTADEYMRKKLGDRFLGYDNGEQDGRYIHASAQTMVPTLDNRILQYRNFQAYFEKLNDAMLNHTVTLASLTFLHYFAKEGNTIMIGAETAQALPNNNMWFAYIRGASKQYGLLNYGNASVWNRWGYKDYKVDSEEPDTSNGYEMGRTGGTSLSQLRRLIYNHYMYNCDILGFESSWFYTEKADIGEVHTDKKYIINDKRYNLTPVGEIQKHCGDFVRRNGFPGTLYTPLAVMADFFSGWVPPRHLYTGDIYKVWGNLPYNTGDYQLHLLFSLLFPGYENAGFYRDERGFLSPAPYGEIADVLLSDIRIEVLNRYTTLFITEETTIDLELYIKLKQFVYKGGHIILFINTVLKNNNVSFYNSGSDYDTFFKTENLQDNIFENIIGSGKVTILNYINSFDRCETVTSYRNNMNEDIPQPYTFKPEITEYLDKTFNALKIISVDNIKLLFTLNIINENEYTLFVSNNTLNTETYNIITSAGNISSVNELVITDGTEKRPEFLPCGCVDTGISFKNDGKYVIKPYDCHIYKIRTEGIFLDLTPESNPKPRNKNLYLSLGYTEKSAKEYMLNNPTFLHHFGGLMLPAEYLDRIGEESAEREAHYLNLQNVGITVDFTRMINHFPDLSIIGNFPNRTNKSIDRIKRILTAASKYRCEGAIFSLQRNAENEYSREQAINGTIESLRKINEICIEIKIPAFIQNRNILISTDEQLKLFSNDNSVGSVAFNTSFALAAGADIDYTKYNSALLILSDIKIDIYGQKYAVNAPVYNGENKKELKMLYRQANENGIPIILYADYKSKDEITEELNYLNS
ncbi:MAG: hypothetical protein ACYCWE_18245 [Eubacteriales bacterium]